jgi:hypothetical protein
VDASSRDRYVIGDVRPGSIDCIRLINYMHGGNFTRNVIFNYIYRRRST